MKNKGKNKRGISLIVLVITIVVIVILSVSVILTVAKNNPIESARKAVFLNDMKTIEEVLIMYIASKYVDNMGANIGSITLSGDDMVSKLPSTKKYKDIIQIEDGKIMLTEKSSEEEKNWAQEAGIKRINVWDGSIDIVWYDNNKTSNTFEISKASELAGLAKIVNEGTDSFKGKTIKLTSDIDLNNIEWTPIGGTSIDDGTGAYYVTEFNGVFDGDYHSISNMKITNSPCDFAALFGYVSSLGGFEASVNNLIVKDSTISGKYAAAIVANLCGSTNSTPHESGVIKDCGSVNNSINGGTSAAGLVNWICDAKVINCYNSSKVESAGNAGGITVGEVDSGSILNCYNTGKITSKDGYAGGILASCVGYDIYNCYNIGEVSGKVYGSLVGKPVASTIKNCYYLSDTTYFGEKDENDDDLSVENIEQIKLENLKTDLAIRFLNSNGYTSYKKDTNNVNNGYPILDWQ